LLIAGVGASTAIAETPDTPGTTGTEDPSGPDPGEPTGPNGPDIGSAGGDSGAGGADDDNRPTSTIGNGRNDVVDPNEPIEDGPGSEAKPARKFQSTIRIPVFRLPTTEEFEAPGLTPPSAYFGTAEVQVPFLDEVLGVFAQPEPQPPPGPAFRTQQEAPVLDAGTGDGGGIDQLGAAGAAPPVLSPPLVVAPPRLAGARPSPIGGSAARVTAAPTGELPAVAGANTPLIRGSLPPSGLTMTRPLSSMSGQARAEAPRFLRNPSAGELSIIALPGVAGLMFLTFSGGVIGYRQANSARFIRTAGAARFLP
jgi:hypothetical protein